MPATTSVYSAGLTFPGSGPRLVTALVVGYPLVTGRIRVGAKGSEPVSRADDPGRFWTTYAFSTGLFLAFSGVLAWFLKSVLPKT